MAKKKSQARRTPRVSEPRMYSDGKPSQAKQKVERPAAASDAAPVRAAAQPVRSAAQAMRSGTYARAAQQPADYSYVIRDLKRLAIVAAVIFAVLIVLGFFIH